MSDSNDGNGENAMQIFELKSVEIVGTKSPDGSYKTVESQLGIFDSRQKAEAFMKIVIENQKSYSRFFAFFIFEKTLNDGLHGPWKGISEFQAAWSYLPDGTFYCHGDCDDICEKRFHGRAENTIMLKEGDFAWYLNRNRIVPCLVGSLPITDMEYQKYVEKLGHDMGLDYSDDSYCVYLYGNDHDHPLTWRLFPYFGNLSKRNAQRLLKSKQWYES
jgi:hypothetical protein